MTAQNVKPWCRYGFWEASPSFKSVFIDWLVILILQVEFSPTLKKLASMMDNIAVQLTACLSIFQRLPDLLTKKRSTKEVTLISLAQITYQSNQTSTSVTSKQENDIFYLYLLIQPVYIIVERDDETKKIQASIKAGMSANASHLQSYLSTWDRYV